MKAVVIKGASCAELRDLEFPPLATDEALIKVLATGCCGTDVDLFEGTMPYLTSGLTQYPFTPGHEWVGEIVEISSGNSGLKPGDRVVGECSCGCMRCSLCRAGNYHRCAQRTETGILNRAGAFAEYIQFPSASLHRISVDVPVASACLIEPAAVAFNGVRRAEITPSDDVAIFGDGPIGLLLLMMAKAFGARSTSVVGATSHRLALAEKLGADAIVNTLSENPAAALARITGGARPSVVIEATGQPSAISDALKSTAPGGRVIAQGIFAGKTLSNLDLDHLVVDELTLKGTLGSPGVWPDVIRLVEDGRIDPSVLVTEVLELGDYTRAIESVKLRHGVKTIIRPNA
jgi:2-desacetyl-2-hydroxyethyl bacteriochlorophyllide A dehydrogenase